MKNRRYRVAVPKRGHVAVFDLHLLRQKRLELTAGINYINTDNSLKHLSAHRACIHSQTSTNTSRDTFHPLKTANARVPGRSRDLFQFDSGAGMDVQTFRL